VIFTIPCAASFIFSRRLQQPIERIAFMPRIETDSISLHYDIFGEGEPLLLIMGFGMPGIAWLPVLPMLSGFKCIYYDNRGTGNSDRPDGIYTIPSMADDASALLRALKIERATIYGVSMGGMIAQELALRHPDKVAKMVLGCTMCGGTEARMTSFDIVEKLVTSVRQMATDLSESLDTLIPLLYPPTFVAEHPELKQMMLAGLSMVPATPPETADRTIAGLMQFDTWERLPEIRCPVLIVHGDQDLLVPPANAEILRARLAHADLIMLPNVGHGYWVSDPAGVHRQIVNWVRAH
jgi:3-oxoadipate enol-lactonase